jgi:hypothetical protein
LPYRRQWQDSCVCLGTIFFGRGRRFELWTFHRLQRRESFRRDPPFAVLPQNQPCVKMSKPGARAASAFVRAIHSGPLV